MTDSILLLLTLLNLVFFLFYFIILRKRQITPKEKEISSLTGDSESGNSPKSLDSKESSLYFQLLESLFERSSLGILLLDEKGQLIGKNRSAIDILEISSDPDIIGSLDDMERIFPEIFNAERRLKKDFSNYVSYDTVIERDDKSTFLRVNYFWFKTPAGTDALVIQISDYTSYKIFENELIRSKNEAQTLNRMKSLFLANMSHEIRTPMNGIIGFSALLKEDLEDQGQLEMAERVYNSAIKLMETLEAVLDLSKLEIENYKSEKHSVDLGEIVVQVYNGFNDLVEKKQLKLSYVIPEHPVIIEIDEVILVKIIRQLLSNAIKFTHTGGILIRLGVENLKKQRIISISVEDTGIGISLKDQEIIFDEFRQVSEGIGRNYEGVGIGLSIVKRFCEMIDAKISIKSSPGNGSKFTLKLKSDTLIRETDSDEVKEKLNGYPKKSILIVEDDYTNRELIKIYLSGEYEIKLVSSANEALEALEKSSFDFLMTDINLGAGMNGIELFMQIKNTLPYVPVAIAMSAYFLTNTEKECLEAGFTSFISKPLKRKRLFEILNQQY